MGVVTEMADRVVVLKSGGVVEAAQTTRLFHHPEQPYTRQLAVLREGEVIESGPVAKVFANPAQQYTRNLINAVPVADPSARDASMRRA